MAIIKKEMYLAECDNCGANFDDGDYLCAFESEEQAERYVGGCGWCQEGGKLYCDECVQEDW